MRRGFLFIYLFFFLLFTFKTTEICFGFTKMGIFCQEKNISHQEKNQEKLFLCLSLKNIPLTPLPVVFQNSVLESSNQHCRAGLSKYHPRAYKSAPQGWSINITPWNQKNQHHKAGLSKSYQGARLSTKIASRSQQISNTWPAYQNSKPKTNKSAPQGRSVKIISKSKIVHENSILEQTNQHHSASLSKKQIQSQKISTTGPVYQNNTPEQKKKKHQRGPRQTFNITLRPNKSTPQGRSIKILSRSKIVYQNSFPETTNQHHRANLSTYHPGAKKSTPQSRSSNITPQSQWISTTGPVCQNSYQGARLSTKIASRSQQISNTWPAYQNSKPKTNKSAPQGRSVKIISKSKIVHENSILEQTNQHHSASLSKKQIQSQKISTTGPVYQNNTPERKQKEAPKGAEANFQHNTQTQ